MAAILYQRAPVAPLPTLFTTGYSPIRRIRRQNSFANGTITTSPPKGPDCANFNGFRTCSSTGAYGECLATAAVSACNCNNGLDYLGCLSSAISTSSCWGSVGIADWDSYQRDWFQDACSEPPARVIQELPQPTKAPLELAPIVIITPPSTIATRTEEPPPITQPTFTGGGQLLAQGDCASTSYTLVSAGDVVYYAAFIGCMADRPECCPWSVAVDSPMATAGGGGTNEGNRVAGGAGRLPIPANEVQALLAKCPDDYYSVSSQGMCCPTGYYKFTAAIQFQTPCFSNLRAKVTPPPLTAGLAAIPTDTRLPTSAILNVALAMGYNVSDPDANKPPLSKGAAIGVGVGVGIVVLLLLGLVTWFCLRVRKKKKKGVTAPAGAGGAGPTVERYTDAAPAGRGGYDKGFNAQPPAPVSPASVSPRMCSVGAVSPSGSPPPGGYAAVPAAGGHGHTREFSDASSAGDWTIASGQGLVPGQQGGQYAPPLPMQYQDRYGQPPAELQQDYGRQGYQGSPSPPPPHGMQQQQEYHPPYSELPPQEYQGPGYGGGQQQGQYEGWR